MLVNGWMITNLPTRLKVNYFKSWRKNRFVVTRLYETQIELYFILLSTSKKSIVIFDQIQIENWIVYEALVGSGEIYEEKIKIFWAQILGTESTNVYVVFTSHGLKHWPHIARFFPSSQYWRWARKCRVYVSLTSNSMQQRVMIGRSN